MMHKTNTRVKTTAFQAKLSMKGTFMQLFHKKLRFELIIFTYIIYIKSTNY